MGDTQTLTLRTDTHSASADRHDRYTHAAYQDCPVGEAQVLTLRAGAYGTSADRYSHKSAERLACQQRLWQTSARRYALAAVACAAFSALYESQSHGVWSASMVCLCVYPLVLGVLPALLGKARGLSVPPISRELWACGVMTLAMGSCLRGVVEIYGTTSALVAPYLPLGMCLLLLALAIGIRR